MWFFAGEDVHLPIEFKVQGEFVVPTVATATIWDASGTPLPGFENFSLPSGETSTQLTIPGASNTLAPEDTLLTRLVSIVFEHQGQQHCQRLSYVLHRFVPITVTVEDVRGELGLDSDELPDRDIDILGAYLQLLEAHNIEVALTANDARSLKANQAIAVRAALNLIPSLTLRTMVSVRAEDSAAERMSKFDPEEIQRRLSGRLGMLLEEIDPTPGGFSTNTFRLTTPTDIITGR